MFGKDFGKKKLLNCVSKNAKCTPAILEKIRKTPESILKNFGTPFARKVQYMSKDVYRDFERARQFTRTKFLENKLLYGIYTAHHSIEADLLDYFKKRFPNYVLCLYNRYGGYCAILDESNHMKIVKGTLKKTLKSLGYGATGKLKFAGQQFADKETKKIYDAFYESQYIKERKNPRYFQTMIPKKVKKDYKLDIERRIGNRQLDEFL